jgi:hypothetical protein
MSNPDNTMNFDFDPESKTNVSKSTAPSKNAKEVVQSVPITESKALKRATPPKAHETFTISKGHHYVVIAVFSMMSHSMKFTKEMIHKGHAVNVILNPKNGLYYVYIYSNTNLEATKRFRNEYKLRNLFKEAWVFTPQD